MTTPIYEAAGLRMEFSSRRGLLDLLRPRRHRVLTALDGIDLSLSEGEALGIVGESGSGKSTLARCIAGLNEPTSGTMRFRGEALGRRRTKSVRRAIQMVFQDPYSSLNPRMSVSEIIAEPLAVHRMVAHSDISRRTTELMDLVRLGGELRNVRPKRLSGGQRQRVSIARALALEPQLLIADEPVSALDVSVQAAILNLLGDLRELLGLTLVLIAHDLAVVRHLCDRVSVMYLGRVVEDAPNQALFADPRHPYTRGLLEAIPTLASATRTHRFAVRGDPPSPFEIPSGCRFRSRCALAQEICADVDPALAGFAGHAAACHFAWPDHDVSPARQTRSKTNI